MNPWSMMPFFEKQRPMQIARSGLVGERVVCMASVCCCFCPQIVVHGRYRIQHGYPLCGRVCACTRKGVGRRVAVFFPVCEKGEEYTKGDTRRWRFDNNKCVLRIILKKQYDHKHHEDNDAIADNSFSTKMALVISSAFFLFVRFFCLCCLLVVIF